MNRGREVLFVMIGPGLESQGASHHCRPARSHSMITWCGGVWDCHNGEKYKESLSNPWDIPTHGRSSPDPGSETGK